MACGGCLGARTMAYTGIRTGNVRMVGQAIRQGIQINVDKARQAYRYGQQGMNKATPYKRPPERTT